MPKERLLWNNPAVQKILYGVIAAVVVLIAVGFTLPRTHSIEVSTEIDAHPATVFALVNDFRRFTLWAPWSDTDPGARFIYSGNRRGVGSTVTWDGAALGTGVQTIAESRPHEYVGIIMNPGEPGEAKSWFRLTGGAGSTTIYWGFEADYGLNFVGRYFGPMLGGVVARDYEAGLANLRDLAESLPSADFGNTEIEHLRLEPQQIALLRTRSRPEPAAMSEAMGEAFFDILSFIDRHGLEEAGAPLSITRTFSGSELLFDAAIPVRGVTDATPLDGPTVKIGQTYGGAAIRVTHVGSYRNLSETHRKIAAYLAALGIERNGAAWESYVGDPGRVPERELLTYVFYPVQSD